jgi:hypothetical protein
MQTSYPLVNIQKAIENGPVEIVDLPIKNGWIFYSYVVYQRVLSTYLDPIPRFQWFSNGNAPSYPS